MLTCQAMHIECTRVLLRSDILLKNPSTIIAFCIYVIKDPEARGPLIRSISISLESAPTGANGIEPLCTALRYTRNLRKLAILPFNVLRFLPRIELIDVLYRLDTLEELEVHDAHLLHANVYRDMRCVLTHLILDWDWMTLWDVDLNVLRSWAPSLKVLHLTSMLPRQSWSPSFPSLQDLSIRISAPVPDIVALLHVCPALRTLRFETTMARPQDIERARQHYVTMHAGHRWPNLDYVSADLPGLYQVALQQPVRRINLNLGALGGHTSAWLAAVLAIMQPTHLQLQMQILMSGQHAFLPELLPAATYVKYLRLIFASGKGIGPGEITPIVRPLSITHLEIETLLAGNLAFRPESYALSAAFAVPSLGFVSVATADRSQSFSILRSDVPGEITVELSDSTSAQNRKDSAWG
ncbi:hypothetical protein CERSUDRAFT_111761 [Gelatoporia subvermispora B]|uniref:F-box domain-containing protein n=1 Tax=Ceriporiopsis subvermispora (strain B) TaxID=914234 RepID=M2R4I3_CERS8|nr:hypothetical protein CERSUDRAFT_111761 [Gelatoporia subvermispora B]